MTEDDCFMFGFPSSIIEPHRPTPLEQLLRAPSNGGSGSAGYFVPPSPQYLNLELQSPLNAISSVRPLAMPPLLQQQQQQQYHQQRSTPPARYFPMPSRNLPPHPMTMFAGPPEGLWLPVMRGGPPHGMVVGGPGGPMMGPPHGPHHPGVMPPPMHHAVGPYYANTERLEFRIYEMNRRLQQRNDIQDAEHVSMWWDAFAREFFDDDAKLTLSFNLDGTQKRYTIGRTLIPRYFRSIYDGGVKDLYYSVRYPMREFVPQPGLLILECEKALMITEHEKPTFTQVVTEGRLTCEFVPCENDPCPRLRHWIFEIRSYHEYVPKHVLRCHGVAPSQTPTSNATETSLASNNSTGGSTIPESLTKDITRQGMTTVTLNYLRLCLILEPMQQLMSQHKQYQTTPRTALTNTLFNSYQQRAPQQPPQGPPQPPGPPRPGGTPGSTPSQPPVMMPPDGDPGGGGGRPVAAPKPQRKRSRKGSQSGGATPTGAKKKNSASPAPIQAFPPASNVDVMVVGEPSLMGGEYGEEDERLISRLENTQFDPAAGPPPGPPSGPHMGPLHRHMGPPPGATMYVGPGGPMDLPPHQMAMWGTPPPGGPQMLVGGGRPRSSGTPQTPGPRIGTPSLQPTGTPGLMGMGDGGMMDAIKASTPDVSGPP